METNLTKKMKKGLAYFKPDMPTNMRTIRFAEEVWTPNGIVDFIRFEDYKKNFKTHCALIDYNEYDKSYIKTLELMHKDGLGKCKIENETFPNKFCEGCVYKHKSYELDMLTTCYECKITLADFKSKNGHNFHGNKNYYVIPNTLYDSIKDLVPNDIGIICYYEKSNSYRIKKESSFKEISYELKTQLLYNAFKKWVDKFHYEYLYGKEDIVL